MIPFQPRVLRTKREIEKSIWTLNDLRIPEFLHNVNAGIINHKVSEVE
jgi:hypothetical protein